MHADHNGQLGRVRALLAWFPPQVHRWLLACQWERIAQEEAFVGRAAQAGDDLGSRLITTHTSPGSWPGSAQPPWRRCWPPNLANAAFGSPRAALTTTDDRWPRRR